MHGFSSVDLLQLHFLRKAALEQALSEKQDFLSRLADVLAWLNQAEKHLAGQKPLGSDYYVVHSQYQAHQVSCECVFRYECVLGV